MPVQTQIRLYICKNLDGGCDYARNNSQFMIREGQDLSCPKCHKRDIGFIKNFPAIQNVNGKGKSKKTYKKTILIASSILLFAFLGWLALPRLSALFFKTPVKEKRDLPNTGEPSSRETVNKNLLSFEYTPTKPSGIIHTKGVIELGAAAFDAFVIRMDEQKNWEKIKSIRGRAYTGIAGSEEVVKNGLRNYIGELIDFGVRGNDIHFVVSSGAHMSDTVKIIEKILTSIGYQVNIVTVKQEAEYGLKASMPKDYYDSAFFVDIGSGNTKVAWVNADKTIASGATFGSKYYEKNISDDEARSDAKLMAQNISIDKRNICFIIGGVPYEMANQSRQKNERYTCLKSPYVYTPDGPKQMGGINIYTEISLSTGCKHFVFDWDSNFTIGFLLYGISF